MTALQAASVFFDREVRLIYFWQSASAYCLRRLWLEFRSKRLASSNLDRDGGIASSISIMDREVRLRSLMQSVCAYHLRRHWLTFRSKRLASSDLDRDGGVANSISIFGQGGPTVPLRAGRLRLLLAQALVEVPFEKAQQLQPRPRR